MFSPQQITSRSTFSGPSFIGARDARRAAQSAYDSELAQAASARRPQTGKGMGAGSGRTGFNRGLRNEAGLAGARSAYANSYMDSVEANQKARLDSDASQSREYGALAGLAQDLSQMDFMERFGAAENQQQLQRAQADYQRGTVSQAMGVIPLLMRLLG